MDKTDHCVLQRVINWKERSLFLRISHFFLAKKSAGVQKCTFWRIKMSIIDNILTLIFTTCKRMCLLSSTFLLWYYFLGLFFFTQSTFEKSLRPPEMTTFKVIVAYLNLANQQHRSFKNVVYELQFGSLFKLFASPRSNVLLEHTEQSIPEN